MNTQTKSEDANTALSSNFQDITGWYKWLLDYIRKSDRPLDQIPAAELTEIMIDQMREFLSQVEPSKIFPAPEGVSEKLAMNNIRGVHSFYNQAGPGIVLIPFNAESYNWISYCGIKDRDDDEIIAALFDNFGSYVEEYDPKQQCVAVVFFVDADRDLFLFSHPEVIDIRCEMLEERKERLRDAIALKQQRLQAVVEKQRLHGMIQQQRSKQAKQRRSECKIQGGRKLQKAKGFHS